MKTRARVLEHLQTKFPALKDAPLADLISENLFADHVLQLPQDIAKQAKAFAAACFELRHNSSYQQHMSTESQARRLKDPGNDAIATSYDFHVDANGVLKLIEINTNASFLALGDELYEALALPRPFADHNNAELKKCFDKEFELCGLKGPMRVAIVDEKPLEQRLYIEFLVYRELMKAWGMDVRILDTTDDLTDRNFIYNRDTDFFLERAQVAPLRQDWIDGKVCVSPHPYEYLLLADKQRLIDWRGPEFFDSIHLSASSRSTFERHLLQVEDLNPESAETLWSKRKGLFFKPKRSFGAKQSYRGSSMSRKLFDELIPQNLLAQEFSPAPEIEIETPLGKQSFKYDLRFYGYRGKIQSVMARLYQGQVTNLRTPYGGFAAVRFS